MTTNDIYSLVIENPKKKFYIKEEVNEEHEVFIRFIVYGMNSENEFAVLNAYETNKPAVLEKKLKKQGIVFVLIV